MELSSSGVDAQIKKNRLIAATITVLGPDRKPAANQEITVAQTRHHFLFGCTGTTIIPLANNELEGDAKTTALSHAESLTNLFNFVTLPFYWGRFEPKRGQPDTARITKTARWFAERGFTIKGHPLCWHTVCADWLLPLSVDEIIKAQLARIRREVSDFAGLIDSWDVINEVVIMPVFAKYDNGVTRMAKRLGRVGIVHATFEAARKANPGATLLLNDFDLSEDFERLIEGCLEVGIKIDAIGIQSHMHQGYWGVEKTEQILARYSKYKLPIHFTENTLVSGKIMPSEIVDLNDYKVDEWPTTPEGEERQARELATHYKTLMAHPAVKAITWWGLQDGGWLKAPSGLLRIDRSRKPAYDALARLVKGDWWLKPTKVMTDAKGQARVEGFAGDYLLTMAGKIRTFALARPGIVEINMGQSEERGPVVS
jgi:endo-1,4-beta-xylanase